MEIKTKKRLFELLNNDYGMKLTENTFKKAKQFMERIENDYVEDFEIHKEKYIKLIKEFNIKEDLIYLEENNWGKIQIEALITRYIRVCKNLLENIEKYNKLEKIQVKSKELYFTNRKTYMQKKDITIDKGNDIIKYKFFEYQIEKL